LELFSTNCSFFKTFPRVTNATARDNLTSLTHRFGIIP
jgi:hypothetical protein